MKHLIEEGTKQYVNWMLKKSHDLSYRHHNLCYNSTMFIGLVVAIASTLFYMRRTKPPPAVLEKKRVNKDKYILQKLSQYNRINLKQDGAFGSPMSSNNPSMNGYAAYGDATYGAAHGELEKVDNFNELYGKPIEKEEPDDVVESEKVVEHLPDDKKKRRPRVARPQWMEESFTETSKNENTVNGPYIPDLLDHMDARQAYHAGMIRQVLMN